MHGIAEGIKDRRHIEVDAGLLMPDVGLRQCQIFGKSPRPIDAHAGGAFAEVTTPCQAVAAPSADDMSFARDGLPGEEVVDIRADGHDLADKLVADHHRHGNRLLGPGVPVVDVEVGAADAGAVDSDQDIVDADFWDRHIL